MNPIAFSGTSNGKLDSFLNWAIQWGPKLQQQGFTRLMWHNPGGHWKLPERGVDARVMWADQWLIAEAEKKSYASREQLAAHHTIMRDLHGIEEIIYYIGSPLLLTDPYRDGFKCCKPFMLPGASLAFDASARPLRDQPQERWKFDRFKTLIHELRGRGHGVYLEARCDHERPEMAGQITGTIATDRYDAHEGRGIVPSEHLALFGEFIRFTDGVQAERDGQVKTWPAEVTPLLRSWYLA